MYYACFIQLQLLHDPHFSLKFSRSSLRPGNDFIFGVAGAEAFLKDLPHAELHLLDGGHFVLEDHVEEIAKYILRFAKRVVGEKWAENPMPGKRLNLNWIWIWTWTWATISIGCSSTLKGTSLSLPCLCEDCIILWDLFPVQTGRNIMCRVSFVSCVFSCRGNSESRYCTVSSVKQFWQSVSFAMYCGGEHDRIVHVVEIDLQSMRMSHPQISSTNCSLNSLLKKRFWSQHTIKIKSSHILGGSTPRVMRMGISSYD